MNLKHEESTDCSVGDKEPKPVCLLYQGFLVLALIIVSLSFFRYVGQGSRQRSALQELQSTGADCIFYYDFQTREDAQHGLVAHFTTAGETPDSWVPQRLLTKDSIHFCHDIVIVSIFNRDFRPEWITALQQIDGLRTLIVRPTVDTSMLRSQLPGVTIKIASRPVG